jgi:hypothetical protein
VVHSGSSGGAATEIQSRSRAFGWACEPPLAMEFKVAAMASSLTDQKMGEGGMAKGVASRGRDLARRGGTRRGRPRQGPCARWLAVVGRWPAGATRGLANRSRLGLEPASRMVGNLQLVEAWGCGGVRPPTGKKVRRELGRRRGRRWGGSWAVP